MGHPSTGGQDLNMLQHASASGCNTYIGLSSLTTTQTSHTTPAVLKSLQPYLAKQVCHLSAGAAFASCESGEPCLDMLQSLILDVHLESGLCCSTVSSTNAMCSTTSAQALLVTLIYDSIVRSACLLKLPLPDTKLWLQNAHACAFKQLKMLSEVLVYMHRACRHCPVFHTPQLQDCT